MFIYTENDTETDKRMKINNLYYKAHQKHIYKNPNISKQLLKIKKRKIKTYQIIKLLLDYNKIP